MRRYFYRVSVCEVYDDKNVQAICDEISFDFEELKEAQKFAITCMKHAPYCVARLDILDKHKINKLN